MTLSLSHIAIATPDIASLLERLRALELEEETRHEVPSEKVSASMIPVEVSPEFRLELLEATETDSPIAKFLEKRPKGGMHHVSFEVSDLEAWKTRLEKAGLEVLPPGIRKAARGRALFIHPKSLGGILVELEELARS